jgi:hypothetical protein
MTRAPDDVIGELLGRHRYGLVRPLWGDLPDDAATKAIWRHEASLFIEEMKRLGWTVEQTREA